MAPLFLQGLAQGIIFCATVIFMTSTTHPNLMSNASVSGVAVRFWTTTIGYAFMQNLQFYLGRKHLFSMSEDLTLTHPLFYKEWISVFIKNSATYRYNDAMLLSAKGITAKLSVQSLLLANTEIFSVAAIISLTVAVCTLLYIPVRQLSRRTEELDLYSVYGEE